MEEYLDRVAEGEAPESVLNDMIVNITPPGPGKSSATANGKQKHAKRADSNKTGQKPGEIGNGPNSQTGS